MHGGGSGVGIAALIDGKVDIATASRAMKPKEIELAKKNTGKEPKQIIVGRDALAIYVHKDNPLDSISIEELAEIYGEGGKITEWKQLGVENPGLPQRRDHSRQPAEQLGHVRLLSRRGARQGTRVQARRHGPKRFVGRRGPGLATRPVRSATAAWATTTGKVKMLKVRPRKGEPAIEPTLATALDGTYPIARPLYLYTLGEPTGAVPEFMQWMLGREGQQIVEEVGYVPT